MRCPECQLGVDESLHCRAGHRIRWRDGYVDATAAVRDDATQRTFDSFGFEWTRFHHVNDEDEDFWRRYVEDVPFDRLASAVAMDIGCGKGRYTRFTAERVGDMVALDGSEAVVAAAANLAHLDNVVVVRADLRRAPFAERSIDLITCLGVLHHLTDPEEGFAAITRLLAPGGVIVVYLYSRPSTPGLRSAVLRSATALRRVTIRVPHEILRGLSLPLAAMLYAAVVAPGRLGDRLNVAPLRGLPLHVYRGKPLRALWLDTFDRLSAPVEYRYRWEDVEPWFDRAGLEVMNVREWGGLMITATRPA